MPIKDNRSNIEANNIMKEIEKTADAVETTAIIDTESFDNGVTFVFNLVESDGPVTITVRKIEESDDSGMAGATTVPAGNLIGNLPTLILGDDEASLNTVGVFGTKRFIRAEVEFVINPFKVSFVTWVYKTDEVKPVIHPND